MDLQYSSRRRPGVSLVQAGAQQSGCGDRGRSAQSLWQPASRDGGVSQHAVALSILLYSLARYVRLWPNQNRDEAGKAAVPALRIDAAVRRYAAHRGWSTAAVPFGKLDCSGDGCCDQLLARPDGLGGDRRRRQLFGSAAADRPRDTRLWGGGRLW